MSATSRHSSTPWMLVRRTLPASAALVALAVLGGCGKSPGEALAEKAISAVASQQAGQKVEVKKDGDTVVIQTEQGAISMAGGDNLKLPSDFPSDVFLPKDYALTAVLEMGNARNIGLRVPTAPGALIEDAKASMKSRGWEPMMAMQGADGGLLTFRKGARMASFSFGQDGDATAMNVQLQDKPPQ